MPINNPSNASILPTDTNITTGAAPLTLDPTVRYYSITSGGTGGVEIVNLPNLPLDANGYNGQYIGQQCLIYLETQTNPSDVVEIHINNDPKLPTIIYPFIAQGNGIGISHITNYALNYGGASAVCIWSGDYWMISIALNDLAWGGGVNEYGYNMDSLPTVNPGGSGKLWNNSGVVNVT